MRDYDCFNIRFREHYGVRWTVLYDPDDPSQALAINDDATLRFLLQAKYVQPMALRDRKEGDAEQLAAVGQFNKQLEQHITDIRSASGRVVHELFNSNPELNDTFTKMLIVDSRGQHKDRRNERKKIASNTEDMETIPVLITTTGEEVEEKEENIYDLI